ncbi:hypothetical protein Cni_G25673 [Canna indica]|uniref:SMP-LTD domain-containing protein n=1 Tax=Canna indica TaxID=4628 RepID=A0AAQ3KYD2_9LILI|nr:hypothetical protein Cni_G25673 [Canna indica]
MSNTLILGVFVGAIVLLAVELLFSAFFYFWFSGRRHGRAQAPPPPPLPPKPFSFCLDSDDDDRSPILECNKQGIIWVLESAKVPGLDASETQASEVEEDKRDGTEIKIVEVCPVLKHAKVRNHKLILTDPDHDSSKTMIKLLDCVVLAVSSSDLAAGKWANRFPIKLESKREAILEGSKICYIYLDTSWEKESWCKALQLASCPEKQKIKNYADLHKDFQRYTASLLDHFSLQKPLEINSFVSDQATKYHKPALMRNLLNTFAKGVPKSGKAPSHGRKKSDERPTGVMLMNESPYASYIEKSLCGSPQDIVRSDPVPPSTSKVQHLVHPNLAYGDDQVHDESAFFLNLIISRLFFDVRRSTEVSNYLKAQIERTLSNVRFPSFFGRVECACLDVGDIPPFVRRLKVVNKDMTEVLTAEIDVEYSGGLSFAFEVCPLGCKENNNDRNSDMNSGIEQMTTLDDSDGYYSDELQHLESATWRNVWLSTWKTIKTTVSDHVLQVPLSLRVRVSSLRATLSLHMKPPPSDQLWFGFNSMPEIDWKFVPTIGNQRISNGAITLLFKKLFENAIRKSLVFPNCEYICTPWMLDDKDDWIPVAKAPFQWISQEAFVDVTEVRKNTPELGQELSMDVLLEELEHRVSEHNASSANTPSSISSIQTSSTPNIFFDETNMTEDSEVQISEGPCTPVETVARKKAAVTQTEEDRITEKKKSFKVLKKMMGASLKKCEKVKMNNIFGCQTTTSSSSQK